MNMRAEQAASPVRVARERAGLTREQLAVKAGISSSTLYLAERANLLSSATAAKVAAVLGITPADLLGGPRGA